LSARGAHGLITVIAARAGLDDDAGAHVLRQSCATMLIREGTPLIIAAELLAARLETASDRQVADRVGGASPGLDAFDWATVLDSHSHVEHDASACHAPDGVEVGLDHFWELSEQEGEAQHQLAQRWSIKHSAAAEPIQLSDDALGGVDQLVGFRVGYRE
jgi:hypothetical protein